MVSTVVQFHYQSQAYLELANSCLLLRQTSSLQFRHQQIVCGQFHHCDFHGLALET